VELLLVVMLSMLLMAGALQIFGDLLREFDSSRLNSELQQNLQAGMNLMIRDLIQTGRRIPTGGIPIPNGGSAQGIFRPGPLGTSYIFPADLTVLPAVSPGDALGPAVQGVPTDIVNILYSDSILRLEQSPLQSVSSSGDSITVNAGTAISGVATPVQAGDLILLSNARGNAIQTVTRVSGQTIYFDANDVFRLNQRGTGILGNIVQLQSSPGAYPPTTATRLWMITYYIDATADAQNPQLMRRINFGTASSIGAVYENVQLTFDLVDGVTNPTNVANPSSPNSPNQIRKANLFLAARSTTVSTRSREFLRTNMLTQVSLRSLAFVDRYR
jgi:Tfp pilus assembly protein PilW